MPEVKNSQEVNELFASMYQECLDRRHEFITPEHMLHQLLQQEKFTMVLKEHTDPKHMAKQIEEKLKEIETVPEGMELKPEASVQMGKLLNKALSTISFSSAEMLTVPHLVRALLALDDSWAAYLLRNELGEYTQYFMADLISSYEDSFEDYVDNEEDTEQPSEHASWRSLVTCINDQLQNHNPLIGRKDELERTMLVLCRKEKNNPLHVGEPGVGKTALIYGLAQLIEDGNVPERLRECRIYQLDLGGMLAGTQFRGDFEKRIKQVMDGARSEGKVIVYIDEIHNLVGAGRTGEGSMDASNMLKPYLDEGDIRFIGSTTYDEYNRYLARSGGIIRRFQQIDIAEPTPEDAIAILQGLKKNYESFHHVTFSDQALEYAVRASHKYINERRLPDKAIDLIDEAGAWVEMHHSEKEVGVPLINDILQKTCKIDAAVLTEDNNDQLETLEPRILSRVFGQDVAVRQVVEAVQMAKAGLLEEGKPLASLLFVGPTGVGKTEVARVLAQELGIQLVRFDMSEYTERHAVAKLIGSPAGYVGYEDGGLLTDAIRKTPNCVLLFDELEKAHSDIYNVLLQVMDYASLTDNKGRKADFRNTVIIMTSNAGAQYAGMRVGFEPVESRGEAMLKQVKRTFKPEFINRLSATVVFRDMDRDMAERILDKKLRELQDKLTAKNVTLSLTPEAHEHLLNEGFTREYGAREMDRVIAHQLKPLLMREILFGRLKQGGNIQVGMKDGKLSFL